MKIKKPDTLFHLIKAMDRGEKRFFNLFCNRQNNKGGKNYIKLFKAIAGQEIYDESILKKESRNYGVHFHLAKSYLYKLIQESLVLYYTKKHSSSYDQLLNIKVLYEKGLFEPAQRMAYNLRKLAEEQNNFFVAIETINLERSLLLESGSLTVKSINFLQKQKEHYMLLYNELELYKQLYDKIVSFDFKYRRMYISDIKKEFEFKKIAHSLLLKNINKPRSTMSKWFLLCARGIYYKILSDYKNYNKEYFAAIKILDRNSRFKKNYPEHVAKTFQGYIISSVAIRKFDLAIQKLSELKKFCYLHSTIETRMALLTCQSRALEVYLYNGNKNEAMQLIDEIDEKITKGEMIVDSNKLSFYRNASETCTLFSEHHRSLYWINKILNFEFAEIKFPNMHFAARIIQLINLTELEEYDLLFYRLKSLRRFLKKQNSIYRYQEVFMNFIRRILKGEFNKNNLLLLYKNVKESLSVILKEPKEAQACAYFDFIGWLESKIQNIPYPVWFKMNLKINHKIA